MPSQILRITPKSELTFDGQFDKEACTSFVRLRNTGTDTVAFKVKATAPTHYTVRPSSGLVQPNSEIQVAITLLRQSKLCDAADSVGNQTKRHKFLIETLKLVKNDSIENIGLDALWTMALANDTMRSVLNVRTKSAVTEASGAAAGGAPASRPRASQRLRQGKQTVPQPPYFLQLPSNQSSESNASNVSDPPSDPHPNEEQLEEQLETELHRLQLENSRLCEEELRLRKLRLRKEARRQRQLRQQLAAASTTSAALTAVAAAPASALVAMHRFLRAPATTETTALIVCLAGLAMGVLLGKFGLQRPL